MSGSAAVNRAGAGLQFSVDGEAPLTAPQTLSLANGVMHTISLATTQPGAAGTQYVFASWSDGGAATHSIDVTAAATYTAIHGLAESLLQMLASTPASRSVAAGFFPGDVPASISFAVVLAAADWDMVLSMG